MSDRIRGILNDLRTRLVAIYGPRLMSILLYGSQARGDAEEQSDIDVLVVLRGEVHPCQEIARASEETAAISLQHDAVIACTFASEDQFRNKNSPFFLNVRREGIAV